MEPTLKFAQIPQHQNDWNKDFEFGFVIIKGNSASCWGPKWSRNSPSVESIGRKGSVSQPFGFTYKE